MNLPQTFHTREELEAAIGGLALDATVYDTACTQTYIRVRGIPAKIVAVRRTLVLLDYGDVKFTAPITSTILPAHPAYGLVSKTTAADAELARLQLAARKAKKATERATRPRRTSLRRRRPRDTQRSRVYAWERNLFEKTQLNDALSLAECQRLVDCWTKTYGLAPVRITDGRGFRRCSWVAADRSIRLPRWGRTRWVLAHEFAHARVTHDFSRGTVAAHGPEFVFRYLELLVEQLGQDWAALVDSLAAAGIDCE